MVMEKISQSHGKLKRKLRFHAVFPIIRPALRAMEKFLNTGEKILEFSSKGDGGLGIQ